LGGAYKIAVQTATSTSAAKPNFERNDVYRSSSNTIFKLFKFFKEISFIPTQFVNVYLMHKWQNSAFGSMTQNRHSSAYAS